MLCQCRSDVNVHTPSVHNDHAGQAVVQFAEDVEDMSE